MGVLKIIKILIEKSLKESSYDQFYELNIVYE